KKGPVCGLSCPIGATLDGRSVGFFTAPSKQSSVQVSNIVPGFKCITGGWPPNVYFSSSCFGMYWTVLAKGTPASKTRHKHAFQIIVAPFSCPPLYARTLEPPAGIDAVVRAWRCGCNLPGSP